MKNGLEEGVLFWRCWKKIGDYGEEEEKICTFGLILQEAIDFGDGSVESHDGEAMISHVKNLQAVSGSVYDCEVST